VRAYSHQGHGPRADQQAGYISATSDSTPSLAKCSRAIHKGQLERLPPPTLSARYGLREGTFAWPHGKRQGAPIPVVCVTK
jgi:hypothetical protein